MSRLLERATATMPGGVNSPVRSFRAVDAEPIFASRGCGAILHTTDGRSLIDFCMSFGPLILGHAHPAVVAAIRDAAIRGTSFAVTTESEIELGERICEAIPSVERVRLVSSGTEACMTAIRLARGATGREKVLKFSGCYHGHADCLLVKAGSGVAGLAAASSAGVPGGCAGSMLVAPHLDREAVAAAVAAHGGDLAAIVVEPVAANMGLITPDDEWLAFLRAQADAVGALLIFDEVITGFRFTYGGYQNLCGVTPDLTCLGKAIGGGMPVGAVGGREAVMNHLAPLGAVYQAGTLSGNPVSVAAGLATLQVLRTEDPYARLDQRAAEWVRHLEGVSRKAGVPAVFPRLGSLFGVFFAEREPRTFEEVLTTDTRRFGVLFRGLLDRGVYLPPSPYEACFLSTAHNEEILERAGRAFAEALAEAAE